MRQGAANRPDLDFYLLLLVLKVVATQVFFSSSQIYA